ncbi:MAG: UbiA family prenyltransferase [Chloroflexota bacterium]
MGSSDPRSIRGRQQSLIAAIIHLRLHFQVLLAPIFLWGLVLAGSRPDGRTWLVFIAYHVFLYGGATAFNSAYDRDQGPVGGLRHPPPVDPFLLPWSLGILVFGLVLALARPWTACLYFLILLLALAYSHPSVRLKARPWASLVTIAVGQGVLPFLAGWLATPEPSTDWQLGVMAAVSAAFVAIAFYPLTQLYQVEEDRQRGDRTVAVVLGIDASFALSSLLLVAAAASTVATVERRFGVGEAVVVFIFYGGLFGAVQWWRRRFRHWDVLQNFRAAMRFTLVGAAGFGMYLLAHLVLAYG